MKKHSARVAPLSACNSPVLTLTKVEGNGQGRRGLPRADARSLRPSGGGGRHPARAPWLWVSPRSPGSVARSAAPHACCLGRGGSSVAPRAGLSRCGVCGVCGAVPELLEHRAGSFLRGPSASGSNRAVVA